MDPGSMLDSDAFAPNTTYVDGQSGYIHSQAYEPWSPPDFTFQDHGDNLSETSNVLRELDSGESSPIAPSEAMTVPAHATAPALTSEPAPPARPKPRRKSATEAERIERRRARNRAAQARFRQKQRVRSSELYVHVLLFLEHQISSKHQETLLFQALMWFWLC